MSLSNSFTFLNSDSSNQSKFEYVNSNYRRKINFTELCLCKHRIFSLVFVIRRAMFGRIYFSFSFFFFVSLAQHNLACIEVNDDEVTSVQKHTRTNTHTNVLISHCWEVENLAHQVTRGHCTRAKFNALCVFDAANAIVFEGPTENEFCVSNEFSMRVFFVISLFNSFVVHWNANRKLSGYKKKQKRKTVTFLLELTICHVDKKQNLHA